ncbi:MAG: hypothetical protein HN392_12660 [Anaerolineae bacterium]|nr:hypothetical protein [Anaerolineae bacterium]MBT7781710.1 hypothetical protein [Anaerolineae bacterium]
MNKNMQRLLFFFLGKEKHLKKIFLGVFFFFGAMHQLLSFWEQPFAVMLGQVIFFFPVILKTSSLLFDFYFQINHSFERNRLFLFFISSLIIGASLGTFLNILPASYHNLTLTPSIHAEGEIEILEIKVGTGRIDFNEVVLTEGWFIRDKYLYAIAQAETLNLNFNEITHAPVTVLSSATTEGEINLILDGRQNTRILHEAGEGFTQTTLHTRYRSIPNIFFVLFIFISGTVFWGSLIFSIFLLQEKESRNIVKDKIFFFHNHRKSLIILVIFSIVINVVNALATPLIVGDDTFAYLGGAIRLLETGSLKYGPTYTGPAWTFFFTPVLWVFGRNPWGVKFL